MHVPIALGTIRIVERASLPVVAEHDDLGSLAGTLDSLDESELLKRGKMVANPLALEAADLGRLVDVGWSRADDIARAGEIVKLDPAIGREHRPHLALAAVALLERDAAQDEVELDGAQSLPTHQRDQVIGDMVLADPEEVLADHARAVVQALLDRSR